MGSPGGSVSKDATCNAGDGLHSRTPEFDLWVRKIPWRRKWQFTPAFLLGKFHGQKNLVGYIQSMGSQESNVT